VTCGLIDKEAGHYRVVGGLKNRARPRAPWDAKEGFVTASGEVSGKRCTWSRNNTWRNETDNAKEEKAFFTKRPEKDPEKGPVEGVVLPTP